MVGLAVCLFLSGDLDLLSLGERQAEHLGVRVERLRVAAIVVIALLTCAAVAFCGIIGFVGLVVPNLVTTAMGDNGRRIIPVVAVSGAGLVLGCDILGRILRYPYEIPVGVIMGVAGSVIFLALLARRRPAHG